jgi:hypothetical protein
MFIVERLDPSIAKWDTLPGAFYENDERNKAQMHARKTSANLDCATRVVKIQHPSDPRR